MSEFTPRSGAELLAKIKPTRMRDSLRICLRPDLIEQWETAESDLAELLDEPTGPQRLADGPPTGSRELAERVQQLEAELEEASIEFTMEALAPARWQAICDNHPPRKDNMSDLMLGYNPEAALEDAVRECLVDPVFDDEAWAELTEILAPSEWKALKGLANTVNRGAGDPAPKSELASRVLALHASGSKRRARGESPRASSTGGSRKKSTSTTTPKAD